MKTCCVRLWLFASVLAAALPPVSVRAASKPSAAGYPRLLQGPMLGAPGVDRMNIWVRLSGPNEVQIEYAPESSPSPPQRTPVIRASKADDYTVVIPLVGLTPATTYLYRVMVAGTPDMNQEPMGFFTLRTAPESPSVFSVALGSCARVERHPVQPIWAALRDRAPSLMLWLGDNVYADTLDPEILAECYQRQRSLPEMQSFIRTVPQLAIWDDHDYGLNDSDRTSPLRGESLRVFQRYWANPAYGLPEAPGVFFSFSYGGVDFFMLDNRYHRDPPALPGQGPRSSLGPAQKTWIKEQLRASRAAFKVVASGQPWTDEKGPGGESWEAFAEERAELINFIREEKTGGVLLLSGDNHVGELNCLPESERGGYDLFELSSSPLAQEPALSWLNYRPIVRVRQVYFGGSNFGLLSFDCSQSDPSVTITLHDAAGNRVWAPLVLRASELQNGVSVWREKMDRVSRQRHERAARGGSYYEANRSPPP